MKNLKKLPTKQLEKFSSIFTQLGLVLVLFVVYVTLEHETEQKRIIIPDAEPPQIAVILPNEVYEFKREPKEKPKPKTITKTLFLENEPIKKAKEIEEETLIIKKTEEPKEFDLEKVIVVEEEPNEPPIETVPFIMIQNTPVFKGCEGLEEQQNRKCFDKKMKKFIQRNFDVNLANEVGLHSGRHKIQTQFIIDNLGNVMDIKIRAPHLRLKKETQKLIRKLPKFKPGKQGNMAVKVKYTLPISFIVD